MRNSPFKVSIVIPVFNEEENIHLFLKKILPIIKDYQYELIFVDDGSIDKTSIVIKKVTTTNKNIKMLLFSRNFGHQMALSAGYQYAIGDCIISIDVDLQDPPQLIKQMVEYWQKGYDVVYAQRQDRHES